MFLKDEHVTCWLGGAVRRGGDGLTSSLQGSHTLMATQLTLLKLKSSSFPFKDMIMFITVRHPGTLR